MVLPDRKADWRPVQEAVFEKIKEIFRTYDEEEQKEAPQKRTYEQIKACFKHCVKYIIKNIPDDDRHEILG